jgi:micrococcal nuclease
MTFKKIISIIFALFFISLSVISCGIFYYNADYDTNKNTYGHDNDLKNIYKVKEVIDGDTLELSDNERVRLLGINTPEHGQYYFEEAKEVLKLLVLEKEVKIEKDITDKDIYGRLLRYVFTGNLFVNEEMVKRGFANAFTFPPDVKYADKFIEAEREARSGELGLWVKSNSSGIEIQIHYDAAGDDKKNLNDEYVIFYNASIYNLDLGGWTVKDSATNIYEFQRFILKADSRVFLYSGKGKDDDKSLYWDSLKPIWNNDHDTLYLRDKNGPLVDIFNY